MKYSFRALDILEYNPETKETLVIVGRNGVPNFNACSFIPEDYINLAMFFDTITKHINKEIKTENLTDIEVY
tara:strand:- start:1026 stop:1241 length:216 start_codon:yes stop_codon:yes gene_type:complete